MNTRLVPLAYPAILIADPFSAGGSTAYAMTWDPFNLGNGATRSGSGALGAKLVPTTTRTVDVCYAYDLVCDFHGGTATLIYQGFIAPIHSQYVNDPTLVSVTSSINVNLLKS